MSANQNQNANQNDAQRELNSKEQARKEKLIRELLGMGVDLAVEVKAIKEKEEVEDKEAALQAIIGNETIQQMVAKYHLQAVTVKWIGEREYTNEDGSKGIHPPRHEIIFHSQASNETLPPQRALGVIAPLLKNKEGKTFSGRGITPSWIVDHVKGMDSYKGKSDKWIIGAVSSKYQENGISKEDHDTIWSSLKKEFPVT